jgi:hypothetical protein
MFYVVSQFLRANMISVLNLNRIAIQKVKPIRPFSNLYWSFFYWPVYLWSGETEKQKHNDLK